MSGQKWLKVFFRKGFEKKYRFTKKGGDDHLPGKT
jgi:hypothetical protein